MNDVFSREVDVGLYRKEEEIKIYVCHKNQNPLGRLDIYPDLYI